MSNTGAKQIPQETQTWNQSIWSQNVFSENITSSIYFAFEPQSNNKR